MQGYVWSDTEGLPDIYITMGLTSENVADQFGITRQEMDQYAFESQQKTASAIERGFYKEEITPYILDENTIISIDDCPRPSTTLEGLAELKVHFDQMEELHPAMLVH